MNDLMEFMPPNMGPPLPRAWGIYWPWYRLPGVPEVEAPPAVAPPAAPPMVVYPPAPAVVYPPVPPPAPVVIAYPPTPIVPEPVPTPTALYACPVCRAQFTDLSDLLTHMEEAHPEAPPELPPVEIFVCPICGVQFSTLEGIQVHMEALHPPEVPAPPPEIPLPPEVPPLPEPELPPEVPIPPPDLPTAGMIGTPGVNLPGQVVLGKVWKGNIRVPTTWPAGLPTPPTMPSYPINISIDLEGSIYDVADFSLSFIPGQTINLPINFLTGPPMTPGSYDIIMIITDIRNSRIFKAIIGFLSLLAPPVIPLPPPPEIPEEVPLPPAPPAPPAEEYTLVTLASPMAAGYVLKNPDKATYSYGEIVTLTARPVPQLVGPSYKFDHWSVNGEWAGIFNPLKYMVVGNYKVKAHFREV